MFPFAHLPKANRPFDLLVFPFWSIFSKGPKRLTFYFQVLWASEFKVPFWGYPIFDQPLLAPKGSNPAELLAVLKTPSSSWALVTFWLLGPGEWHCCLSKTKNCLAILKKKVNVWRSSWIFGL